MLPVIKFSNHLINIFLFSAYPNQNPNRMQPPSVIPLPFVF